MSFKLVETNECEIRITARNAGDFGFLKIGGRERSPREEYRLCEEIVSNIKRHVDDVGWTFIQQKRVHETEDGYQFDTLFEVLEHLYDEDGTSIGYSYRFVRPSDNGTGTRRTAHSFEHLIEEAYRNPWEFTIISGPVLTEAQQKFLIRVIDASLDEKLPKEEKPHEDTQSE